MSPEDAVLQVLATLLILTVMFGVTWIKWWVVWRWILSEQIKESLRTIGAKLKGAVLRS